jgi:hypothetical protein
VVSQYKIEVKRFNLQFKYFTHKPNLILLPYPSQTPVENAYFFQIQTPPENQSSLRHYNHSSKYIERFNVNSSHTPVFLSVNKEKSILHQKP